MNGFPAPDLGYIQLLPLIILFGMACVQVLVEAFAPRRVRFPVQLGLSVLTVLAALAATIYNLVQLVPALTAYNQSSVTEQSGSLNPGIKVGVGSIAMDGPGLMFTLLLLVLGLFAVLVIGERRLGNGVSAFTAQAAATPGSPAEREALAARNEHTEIFPLFTFALLGMVVFATSNDLLTLFVGLEVMSLPLYLMAGMARRRRLQSQEASLKYFLLGAMSSAIFLYGIAMLYGYSGSLTLGGIADAIDANHQYQGGMHDGLLLAGIGLIAIGLLFKVGAVPFHSWTPDVYQGSPTSVTGFMAACTKVAAFAGLLRVFYVALGAQAWNWQPLLAVISVLTMAVGAILAVTQTDVKRMLAYSSIAHAGFVLTAVTGAAQPENGMVGAGQLSSVSSIVFYLLAYGIGTLGAFAVVTMVRDEHGEVTDLAGWRGLGRKNPVIAGVFTIFLLSFAGIPLTGGFIGKWSVFIAAWQGGYAWLVVVAVLMSLVAAFFYLRVIVVMFFTEPDSETRVVTPSWLTLTTVAVGCLATVILGILPGPVLNLVALAPSFIR